MKVDTAAMLDHTLIDVYCAVPCRALHHAVLPPPAMLCAPTPQVQRLKVDTEAAML